MSAAVLLFAITIKSIGILGPITGSQDTAGQVDVDMPATLHLESSNPHVAAVPESIFARGVTNFPVKTFAVKGPVDVTITARIGTESRSATLRVLPPKLFVGCDVPAIVSAYTPLKCKAFLDGLAAEDMSVAVKSDRQEIKVPPSVTIARGTNKTEFIVKGWGVSAPVSGQISVTSGGDTKSQAVTVRPIAIVAIKFPSLMGDHRAQGCSHASIEVDSMAPAPGLNVRLSSQSMDGTATPIAFDNSTIQMNSPGTVAFGGFAMRCVSQNTGVLITASADFAGERETVTTDFEVKPARLVGIEASSPLTPAHDVPPGGVKRTISIRLDNEAGPATWFDVSYNANGTARITGPARVQVPYGNSGKDFEVTLWPCPAQPPCHGWIEIQGLHTALGVIP